MSGAYSWVHFYMSRPWPKAAFNEDSHCGAFTVTASGLFYDSWSSFLCSWAWFHFQERSKETRRREVVKEINERLFIFIPLGLLSTPFFCLSVSLPPTSDFFHLASPQPKSSHLDYAYCSESNRVKMHSFHASLSLALTLSLNLLHVHDTNTETDISSPASLYDIYHHAS